MSLVCLSQDNGSHPFASLDDSYNVDSWACNSLPQAPWPDGPETPLTQPLPPAPTPTPVPTIPPPPPCPAGTGPNGIVAGSYPPQRLTQEERQWLYEIFGNSGTASVGYGGEECGESYFDSNLNFFAMVCSWNHTGPGNLTIGGYPPQNLTQEQRQWLYNEFRAGSGQAPVGYGGEHCPQYGDKTSWEVHIENVCASGAIGPGVKPGDYVPQELTQEQRQWLWDTFGEFGGGTAPVGYGGHACPGQTEHYQPVEQRIVNACNNGSISSTGIKPKGYPPQDLTQEERQWLWNMFQEGSGEAPVGYGGQMCLGQTELGNAQADRDSYNSSGGGSTGVGSQVCPSAPTRLQPGDIAVNTVSGLNVREHPRLSASVSFVLSYSELVTIVSGPSCSDGMYWWQIGISDGRGGFIPEISPNANYTSSTANILQPVFEQAEPLPTEPSSLPDNWLPYTDSQTPPK